MVWSCVSLWHTSVCHYISGWYQGRSASERQGLADQCDWHSEAMVAMLITVVDCTGGYTWRVIIREISKFLSQDTGWLLPGYLYSRYKLGAYMAEGWWQGLIVEVAELQPKWINTQ